MIDISIFKNNLFEAGTGLFNQLGIRLNSNTASSLGPKELLKDQYKDKDIFRVITETYFLGLVDDSVFDSNASLLSKDKISLKEASGKINAEYNGLMVFAVKLPDSYSPKRSDIADLTRAFNRASKNIPVVLLLKYGNLLSFATSERTRYKQEWREGEKIGKISLLKDINIDSPHTGHLKILDDLKIEPDAADFNALYKQWREVFDVQLLNKKFYQELADWYFWALDHVDFPDDVEKDVLTRNATNVIRLLTRLVFCWFLKEKGLIPNELFSERKLATVLKSLKNDDSTFYRAILQNLFFGTLNQRMNTGGQENRKFTNDGSFHERKDEYGVKNMYRYQKLFAIAEEEALKLFSDIPFLNGGLFDCLDKEDDSGKVIYVDGFTRNARKQPKVPNFLFFSDYRTLDLSDAYGDKKRKKEKVRGLINLLDSYKFTVTENTPIEEEIALDPELLGKVFENLLASYNPETGTTARKQTGSFYTPREIVHYMVDESLIAYLEGQLKVKVPKLAEMKDLQKLLREVFAYTEKAHPFDEEEVNALIDAIDTCKILDPACGSGAFPMGILHKLVFILGKLDPHNERWKRKQIDKLDSVSMREEIERTFENNDDDYGRKLYLIENCIYGVDIQPIAIQISKLRFFISLICDQRTNKNKAQNCGVRPLPNLETKFVAANTLISLDRGQDQGLLTDPRLPILEKELSAVRHKHFAAQRRRDKLKLQKRDAELREEIAAVLAGGGMSGEASHHLAAWDPYDQNTFAVFFDAEWMYGIRDGFDVVIGNPPYVRHEAIKDMKPDLKKQFGDFFCGTADIYTYFYKRGLDILKQEGHLCFIAPNKFMRAGYGKNTRKMLATEGTPKVIIDFCDLPIFDATTYPSILLIEKGIPDKKEETLTATFTNNKQLERLEETLEEIGFPMPVSALKEEGWNLERPEVLALMEKLRNTGIPLREYVNGKFYRGILTGLNEAFVIDDATRVRLISEDSKSEELIKPWLRGRDIKKWKAEWAGLYLINIPSSANKQWPWTDKKSEKQARDIFKHTYPAVHDHLSQWADKLRKRDDQGRFWWELRACAYYKEFEQPKIAWCHFATNPIFSYDMNRFYSNDKSYIMPTNDLYLLGFMNSSITTFFIQKLSPPVRGGFHEMRVIYVEQTPIADASNKQEESIMCRVKKILKNPDSHDVPRLEKEIDKLIYDLYNLTPEEIAIVEEKDES